MRSARQGFTLVEMSVVLAIIGVIIGGVLAGQYLTRQAQLQSIGADLTRFKAAYVQFKTQYNGLPGDITDATNYWYAASGNSSDNYTTTCNTGDTSTSPKTATCNGDGNNQIADGPESFRAWQQLSDAGLIEGAFSGITGSGGAYNSVPGQNAPAGKIPNTTHSILVLGAYTGDSNPVFYNMASVEIIGFGLKTTSEAYGPVLTVREQYNIDLKMDDGKPSTGNIASYKSILNPSCTTSDVSGSAIYKLTSSGSLCSILYSIDP